MMNLTTANTENHLYLLIFHFLLLCDFINTCQYNYINNSPLCGQITILLTTSLLLGLPIFFQYLNLIDKVAESVWCVSSLRALAVFSAFSGPSQSVTCTVLK